MRPGAFARWLRFLRLIWTPAEAEIRSRRRLPGIHSQTRD